jgi:AcrR family transcriptional regulator
VLRVALPLIEAAAPGAFTMRQLAEELGIGVMTLYGYVRDKDELYEGVMLLAFAEMQLNQIPDSPWYEQIRTSARQLHDLCQRHPNLTTTLLADRKSHPGLFYARERIFVAMQDAGFPTKVALHALAAFSSYVLGFAIAENSRLVHDLPDRIREQLAAESPGVADDGPAYLDSEGFEYGLSMLIQSLRAEHAAL